MSNRPEIYVSTDIEADGPIPGPNSMLSLGSAAFSVENRPISTSEKKPATARSVWWLKILPGSLVFVAYPAGFDFLFTYW